MFCVRFIQRQQKAEMFTFLYFVKKWFFRKDCLLSLVLLYLKAVFVLVLYAIYIT